MKKRFSETQIIGFLQEAETGQIGKRISDRNQLVALMLHGLVHPNLF